MKNSYQFLGFPANEDQPFLWHCLSCGERNIDGDIANCPGCCANQEEDGLLLTETEWEYE